MSQMKVKVKPFSIPNGYIPSQAEVIRYSKIWIGSGADIIENALNKIFFDLCPYNKEIEDVLLKCSTLNNFYSTNIYDILKMSVHIRNIHNIDSILKHYDADLVNEIAKVDENHTFYSFATKFCSHHNPKDYAIYDSYVERTLLHFQKRDNFYGHRLKQSDLRDYSIFRNVLLKFCEYYGINCQSNMKEIDKYLWQLGKKYFSPYPIARTNEMISYLKNHGITLEQDTTDNNLFQTQELMLREAREVISLAKIDHCS